MPGQNLTKLEAETRASQISQVEYKIKLYLEANNPTFRSVSEIRFQAQAGSQTFVDLIAESVNRIELNGQELASELYQDSRIQLENLDSENVLTVDAQCCYMHTGEGLHRFTDPADNLTYVYSQFEVPDARRVFACFEQPDLKARFQFDVTVPSSWVVLSNSRTPAPKAASTPGFETFSFAQTEPISTYITAIVAGPYHEVRDELVSCDGRTIPLGVYCRQFIKAV